MLQFTFYSFTQHIKRMNLLPQIPEWTYVHVQHIYNLTP